VVKPFDTTVVAVDFSPASIAAARVACRLAGPGDEVRLVNVVDAAALSSSRLVSVRSLVSDLMARFESEARRRLDELARELAASLGPRAPRITTGVSVGRPADGVLGSASDAGLLVVGSHAQGNVERFFVGSVAEELVRRCAIPTLVVREGAAAARTLARVVVAIDLDAAAPEAIVAADQLARRAGVSLVAVTVVPWPAVVPGYPFTEVALSAALVEAHGRVLEDAPQLLRDLVARTIGRTVEVAVSEGAVADGVLAFARADDVLVCGTHGRGALGRLAFGSVATRLLRRAPCPVLVVRPGVVNPPE
jgi:nucleotide-binding universal stress UspA family protein